MDAVAEIKRFSDFADEPTSLEGDKLRLDDILNQEIIVCAFNLKKSKYSKNDSGKYLTLQFKISGNTDKNIVFTGSDILINQIEKYEDNIPFMATIKRVNRYYTFT